MTYSEVLENAKKNAKPILFNTAMVQAILNGEKTETRRAIKPSPARNAALVENSGNMFIFSDSSCKTPPYNIGDFLYVRETWGFYGDSYTDANQILFRADYPIGAKSYYLDEQKCDLPKWRPSLFMPKEVARLFLFVTDIKAARIEDMSLEDFINEGVGIRPESFNDPDNAFYSAQRQFFKLWDSTIDKKLLDIYGAAANPWLWVIKFKKYGEQSKEV